MVGSSYEWQGGLIGGELQALDEMLRVCLRIWLVEE